ncbi:MAG: hypothetical protein ACFB2X_26240 [Rivularia sp. (in: cyanobacteria)]
MKLRLSKAFFTAGVVALGIITAINEPSQAQGRNFYCGQSQGVPSTLVNTPRGTVVVVKWVSRQTVQDTTHKDAVRKYHQDFKDITIKEV